MTMLYKMVSIPSCASLSETLTQDLNIMSAIRLDWKQLISRCLNFCTKTNYTKLLIHLCFTVANLWLHEWGQEFRWPCTKNPEDWFCFALHRHIKNILLALHIPTCQPKTVEEWGSWEVPEGGSRRLEFFFIIISLILFLNTQSLVMAEKCRFLCSQDNMY